MNYVEEKYIQLKNLAPEDFNCSSIYKLKVADVKIELRYSGKNYDKVKVFLDEYFESFDTFLDYPDVTINYLNSNHETYGDSLWEGWNNWTHEIELINFENYLGIMQRDFVAKVSREFDQVYAIGPMWSFETCDSIDNIISYVLAKHIVSKNGLVLHAACVVVNDRALVFFGKSGVGKSTIADFSYKRYGFKVISSDQVILKYVDNSLYALVVPTTIPEFPLSHSGREKKLIKVKSIIHLVQGDTDFSWRLLSDGDFLRNFMRELVYRNEFKNERVITELSLKILSDSNIIKGEMSYKKDTDYYNNLTENWSSYECK